MKHLSLWEPLHAVRGVDVRLKAVLNYLLCGGITQKKVHNIYMLYYKCANHPNGRRWSGGRAVGRGLAPGVSKLRCITQEFSIRSALGGNQGGIRANELNFAESPTLEFT